jgi:hypothetical protein
MDSLDTSIDLVTSDEAPSETFPRDFTLSDHAELCAWIDVTDRIRGDVALQRDLDAMWAEEMVRRDLDAARNSEAA